MNPRAPARNFTSEDVKKWFDEWTRTKAADYVDAVSQLHVSDYELSALVQGTEKRPYTVRVAFIAAARGGSLQISPHCTCPVGWRCKHGAAVMQAALNQRDVQRNLPDPRVLCWLKDFRSLVTAPEKKPRAKKSDQLFYVLDHMADLNSLRVEIYKARPLADGSLPAHVAEWNNIERALLQPPAFVDDEDLVILRMLWLLRDRETGYYVMLTLTGRKVDELLPRLLATGRCLYNTTKGPVLHAGPARAGAFAWQTETDGRSRARIMLDGHAKLAVLPTEPPWYVDARTGEAGPVELDVPAAVVTSLLAAPALSPIDAGIVARELAELLPTLPRPQSNESIRELRVKPRAHLRLLSQQVETRQRWRQTPPLFHDWLDFARPHFDYAGLEVTLDDAREFRQHKGETVRIVRDREAEAVALKQLQALGFEAIPASLFQYWSVPTEKPLYGLASPADWAAWMDQLAPALRAAGWVLEITPDFRHHLLAIDEVFTDVEDAGMGWLEVGFDIEVEGERIALAPLLARLLREQPRLTEPGMLDSVADDSPWQTQLDDGRRLRFTLGRLKPVLRAFVDLFDGTERLKVSTLDAPRLDALLESRDQSGLQAVLAARQRLERLSGMPAVKAPPGLGLQLRPYQLEGLAWLQQLRELGLAGILADDMGLGKTAQTLAHLLTEKRAGRLDRPALVVLPTSLVFNWRREAAVVAPALSVLVLHGPQRDFAAIPKHDVVLTTYPLVWRDAEALKAHDYHLLILDEAQTVKNAASKAAATVRSLRARHRLCLTGTPMENHLGELWAQFDFLLPGFLGDSKDFTRRWRTPIEKGGDALRRELLAARVKPFILRRRKEDVASELPPKNIVLRTVALEAGQRDLYETVRAAMDEKVRQEVAAKGFKRSQIVILDALLKLRQVCCDPRLLSLASAAKVKEHAKLELLMEMLPELVAEGRRVLLFSQFTSMLGLIEAELDKAGIGYVKLTGQTRKREEAVRSFQEGSVPVFLISLKAGGVGLNLTAADTVIHFDPWWNPAAEDQATDRAHRIGQKKSVFVYKLIAAGSIEERIVALQEKKSALAAAVLSGDAAGDLKFSEADLASLFAPLPEIESAAPRKGRKAKG